MVIAYLEQIIQATQTIKPKSMCHLWSFPKKLQRKYWCYDKMTAEGTQLEAFKSLHNFHKLILKPTHLLPQSNYCIDLISTNQQNVVANSGTHVSLNPKWNH